MERNKQTQLYMADIATPCKNTLIKISIIVPVYNAECYIETCARTLFSQTLNGLEYVFVDDASTDNSIALLKKMLKDFPDCADQVTIIQNEKNCGPLAARKIAIKAAKGEYVAFCDADDYVEPDMYEKMYKAAQDSNADLVHCGVIIHHCSGKIDYCCEAFDTTNCREFVFMESCGKVSPFLWAHMFRRDVLSPGQYYLPDTLVCSEDLLLISQVLRSDLKIVSIPLCGYHYIRNKNSISHNAMRRNMLQTRMVMRYLDRTEKDSWIVQARKTKWRDFIYTYWRNKLLTGGKLNALLRHYCAGGTGGRNVIFDENLKWKKRFRLFFLWLNAIFLH